MPNTIRNLILIALGANVLAAEAISLPQPVPSPSAPIAVRPALPIERIVQHWRHDVTAPRLAALPQRGRALNDAAIALCEKTTQERLDTARLRWIDAFLAWRAADVLPLDPALQQQADPGPVESPKLETAIRTSEDQWDPMNPPSTAGLRAIEFLYWGNDQPKAQQGRLVFRRRCSYSALLAGKLARELDNAGARPPASASEYLQRFSAGIGQIMQSRLPGTGKDGKVSGEYDAWRSKQTKAAMQAGLATLESAFAEPAKNGISLIDALNEAGQKPLAEQLAQALNAARREVDALPSDSNTLPRDGARLTGLNGALSQLQKLIDGPLSEALARR
ncbi:imelysin family protein [Chitinimonas sp.]|uniref:imelysin family protein n=1 Tax=Chitinimonas sp. TaxID=1934313 RepID=UPI0035AF744F